MFSTSVIVLLSNLAVSNLDIKVLNFVLRFECEDNVLVGNHLVSIDNCKYILIHLGWLAFTILTDSYQCAPLNFFDHALLVPQRFPDHPP